MHIQVNTSNEVEGSDELSAQVTAAVEGALEYVRDQVSRVEVHLDDVNSDKGGPRNKSCTMEARIEGRRPDAVEHRAASLEEAFEGAAEKLKRLLDSTLGRMHDR